MQSAEKATNSSGTGPQRTLDSHEVAEQSYGMTKKTSTDTAPVIGRRLGGLLRALSNSWGTKTEATSWFTRSDFILGSKHGMQHSARTPLVFTYNEELPRLPEHTLSPQQLGRFGQPPEEEMVREPIQVAFLFHQ